MATISGIDSKDPTLEERAGDVRQSLLSAVNVLDSIEQFLAPAADPRLANAVAPEPAGLGSTLCDLQHLSGVVFARLDGLRARIGRI